MNAACALALGLATVSVAQEGTPEPHRQVLLKVFLADFDDIPHPASYSRVYFDSLFFGLGEPRTTPDGRGLSGSVREYFLNLSEGQLDIGGEVVDWARLPGQITRIPHWKGGMEPFGESWPVIVAETLRAHGIVGEAAARRVLLSDGRRPDLLVFLNTDWGVGGVNRGWGHTRDVLNTMHRSDLWDDAWLSLPSPFSSFSATDWRGAPTSGRDGTIDKVPPESELRMFPLSIMMHEMAHQLAGWPDLYGGAYAPWGVFDLMGGPAASTHFPMTASAYLRESSGWMRYTDMACETRRGLDLGLLDTHRVALRFPQGPMQEMIVAETRSHLTYPGEYGTPPTDGGPRLLLYRVDPAARRCVMYGDSPQPKITTVIRRPERYGEMWGEGNATEVTAATAPSSRNSLGELWWEFRGIGSGAGGDVRFDAEFAGGDLVEGYTGAVWTTEAGAGVVAGAMGEPGAQAAIRWATRADGTRARVLFLRAAAGGSLRGTYPLSPAPAPRRLYALVRPRAGGDRAVSLSVIPFDQGSATTVALGPERAGQRSVIVADIPPGASAVGLELGSDLAADAEVDIDAAWLVGLPPAVLDCTDRSPPGAAWLADGCAYGPRVLTVPVAGDAPAVWSGEWAVALPKEPTTLRALIGLAADTPAGAGGLVGIRLVTADREFPLLENLRLHASAESSRNPLTVIEAGVPGELAGVEATLVLSMTAEPADRGFRLALPCLSITATGPQT